MLHSMKQTSREQERFASKQRTFCRNALRTMLTDENSINFSRPVSELWDLNDLPDYTVKVKQPMDLGTVKEKLDSQVYSSEKTGLFDHNLFATDVRLTFQNAILYNEVGTDMYDIATRFLAWFDDFMKDLPVSDEKSSRRSSTASLGSPDMDGREADTQSPVNAEKELSTLLTERSSLETRIAAYDTEHDTALTDEARTRLRDEIEDLSWEKCKPIVDILKFEIEAALAHTDDPAPDYVDLDLDQVQACLVRQIYDYLHPPKDPERREQSTKLADLNNRIRELQSSLPPSSHTISKKKDRGKDSSKDRDRDRRRRKK